MSVALSVFRTFLKKGFRDEFTGTCLSTPTTRNRYTALEGRRSMKATRLLPFLLATLLTSSVVAFGQTTGSISGTVFDEKGAVIPNATVTARNVERNITRTLQTSSEGTYRFENLPVGPYEVSIEASGFAKYVQ
jgi:hypothetical protein